MDEEERDELTPDEQAEAADTGETDGEAHRAGEFAELRDMLQRVLDAQAELRDMLGGAVDAMNSVAVDNGAQITDEGDEQPNGEENGAIEVTEEIQDPRARDYTIKED